jgi:hypothetical protein
LLSGVAGLCETLPLILQSHPSISSIAIAGSDAMSFISEQLTNGYAERLGHAGGCEAIVSVLRKHSNNSLVVSRASIALATLARSIGNARYYTVLAMFVFKTCSNPL